MGIKEKLIQVINEALKSSLEKSLPTFICQRYIETFDINTIPFSIRKNAYKNFNDIFNFTNRTCREWVLDENDNYIGEIEKENIESARIAINNLINVYKFDEHFFKAFSPYKVCIVDVNDLPIYRESQITALVPNIDKNVFIIEKEMNAAGYYKSLERYKKDSNGEWAHLMFDPIRQDSITKQIKDNCNVLFHYSELKNNENIMLNGLLPKNEGRRYKYNENRIYLFPDKLDGQPVHHTKMMKGITSNRLRNESDFDGTYNCYTILVKKLPDNIEFYDDPHGNGCIYTKMQIPKNAIIDIDEVNFKK